MIFNRVFSHASCSGSLLLTVSINLAVARPHTHGKGIQTVAKSLKFFERTLIFLLIRSTIFNGMQLYKIIMMKNGEE